MYSGRSPRTGTGGLTKTQQLRQAKSAALVKELERKHEGTRPQEETFRRRRRVMAEPKKVDFSKPTMTKAMLARVKHSEKFKQEYERKREEVTAPGHKPKRTAAPIGGDARLGREKVLKKQLPSASSPSRLQAPQAGPSYSRYGRRSVSPATKKLDLTAIPEKTFELARTMNADVVQAEPISGGPIDSIVIPPGVVNDNRTTIISIPQAGSPDVSLQSQIANRSIQVISETLEDQEATMHNKLVELQQARRDFVNLVTNVEDENADATGPKMPGTRRSPVRTPPRRLYKVPDLEEDIFRIEYQRDHPDVVAAREFAQKSMAALREREAARRMEEEFERLAGQSFEDDLRLDVPFDEELLHEGDISWEEDEEGIDMPCPSRIKASMPAIPRRHEVFDYEPFDPEELERFFDVQRYPTRQPSAPPSGREGLHRDLWELDDPWYRPPPEPDMPDLIDFES